MLKYFPIVFLAASLLTLQPVEARVVRCFLFVCHVVHTTHVHHRHVSRKIENSGCDEINSAFASVYADQSGHPNRDAFVKAYPPSKQHHVLECIGDQ